MGYDFMQEFIFKLISVFSVPSLIISIYTIHLSKRKNVNEYVTQSRIKWISEVRKLLTDFLIEYTSPNCQHDQLLKLKISIDLYLTYSNSMYDQVITELDYCIKNKFDGNESTLKRITTAFQIPLNAVWRNIKNESGKKIEKENNELKQKYFDLVKKTIQK